MQGGEFDGELMVDDLSDAELADDLQAIVEAEARMVGYKVRRVVELAALRPNCLDVPAGHPGARAGDDDELLPETSEFFADELGAILNTSARAAGIFAAQAFVLRGQLRETGEALEEGRLDWPRARLIADELGWAARETHPLVIAEVEAAVLPLARELKVRALQARIRAELIARDPAAAERRRRDAEAGTDVKLRPAPDGMAVLLASMPRAQSQAVWDTLNTLARQAQAGGDPRPIGVLKAVILVELVTRPWDNSREPVTANVTIHAPLFIRFPDDTAPDDDAGTAPKEPAGRDDAHDGGDPAGDALSDGGTDSDGDTVGDVGSDCEPGAPAGRVVWLGGAGADPFHRVPTVNGQPITPGQLRDVLHQLDCLGLRAPAGGSLLIALHDPATGRVRGVVTRAELERLVRRGCPEHPGGNYCHCPVLDVPPPVDRYEPTPAQRRFVTTRDRTCRYPGCSNRAGWADLDHVVPHAEGGETCCRNLCCACRRHHRLKTHAPGWIFTMAEDGVLTVTTPSGVTRISRPPGLIDPACDPPPF